MKHIKKSGIVMVLILVTALCIGCGSKVNEEKSNPSTENHSSQVEEETQATENQHTKDMLDTENNKAESIQDEIAKVEDKSREYENADWGRKDHSICPFVQRTPPIYQCNSPMFQRKGNVQNQSLGRYTGLLT